jgi:glutaredoxin-related protein
MIIFQNVQQKIFFICMICTDLAACYWNEQSNDLNYNFSNATKKIGNLHKIQCSIQKDKHKNLKSKNNFILCGLMNEINPHK